MKIAIGADCLGYGLKAKVAAWLELAGHEVVDCGTHSEQPDEKLMDYADSVAGAVARGEAQRGVLVCKSGGMMLMRANRWPGVRAVQGFDKQAMLHDREASDVNVVALGAAYTAWDVTEAVLSAFMDGAFEPLERRVRRVAALERKTGGLGHDVV